MIQNHKLNQAIFAFGSTKAIKNIVFTRSSIPRSNLFEYWNLSLKEWIEICMYQEVGLLKWYAIFMFKLSCFLMVFEKKIIDLLKVMMIHSVVVESFVQLSTNTRFILLALLKHHIFTFESLPAAVKSWHVLATLHSRLLIQSSFPSSHHLQQLQCSVSVTMLISNF